jgi:hypothetical protein
MENLQASGSELNEEKSELLEFELSKGSTVKRGHGNIDSQYQSTQGKNHG